MTQKEKLLLKDLSARLPYRVKVTIEFTKDKYTHVYELRGIDNDSTNELKQRVTIWNYGFYSSVISYPLIECRPYLRPMSSMTNEEKDEIAFIRDRDFQSVRKWIHDESIKETGNICPITCGEIDYCNKKHLDYRGLIPMGLALEAPDGMYNIN